MSQFAGHRGVSLAKSWPYVKPRRRELSGFPPVRERRAFVAFSNTNIEQVPQASFVIRKLLEKGGCGELLCHEGAKTLQSFSYAKGINAQISATCIDCVRGLPVRSRADE
jgi:hypothetical protein